MKIINDKVIDIPYCEREEEEKVFSEYISDSKIINSHQVMLIGKSGTGKTTFIKKILEELYKFNKNSIIIYYDLNHDEFTNSLFLELLIGVVFSKKEFDKIDSINIPKDLSFRSFIQNQRFKKDLKNNIYTYLIQALSFIPTIGGYLEKILSNDFTNTDYDQKFNGDFRLLFIEYFNFISRKNKVYLALDNYQFLPNNIRVKFEASLRKINNKIIFLSIIRTLPEENDYQVYEKFKVFESSKALILSEFNKTQINNLLKSCFPEDNLEYLAQISEDCYYRTLGNLKEIEQFIFSIKLQKLGYSNPFKSKILDSILSDRISRLNSIQTTTLALASMFPNGLRLGYVKKILDMSFAIKSQEDFKEHIELLIKFNFIYLNGIDNDLVKPSHEKIINSIKNTIDEDRFLEIRTACIETFKRVIESSDNRTEYTHLISNLIGILKAHELKTNIKYFIKLLNILYQTSNFYQVIILFEKTILNHTKENKNLDILSILPDFSLIFLLESFQKTSNFELGLSVTKYLTNNIESATKIDLVFYKAKYLVQLYRYNEASKLISKRKNDIRFIFLDLNILQHLRKDDEVMNIVDNIIKEESRYSNEEYYFIILRNSGHIFDYHIAVENLKKAIFFFENTGNYFGKATCINNLGLVYLYEKIIDLAKSNFRRAEDDFSNILSNEIYQPQFNLGVCSFLLYNFDDALIKFKLSISNLPKSLEFDAIKFYSNIHFCELMLGFKSIQNIINLFEEYFIVALRIPDPWLIFMLKFNKGALMILGNNLDGNTFQQQALDNYPGNPNIYGIMESINYESQKANIILAISPHWRY